MASEDNREIEEKSPPKKKTRAHVNLNDDEAAEGAASDDGSLLPGLHDEISLEILALMSRSDYSTLACLNKKYKSLIGSETLYEVRRKLGIKEQWVFMACIMMPWEVFDPWRRRWMTLPVIPSDDCFSHTDKESLAVGTDLLVFGREVEGLVTWKYSLVSRKWTRNQGMNSPRCLFGASSVNIGGQVEVGIVAGGCDMFGKVVQSAEQFNSAAGTWTALPDLISGPRKMCAGFCMDGKFYVIGGLSSNANFVTSGEEYDMERGTWRVIENMYPPEINGGGNHIMCSPPLVAVVKNELYAADLVTDKVQKYNKENNTWSTVKWLPIRAGASHGWGLGFRACGNKLMVIGGRNNVNETYENENDVITIHSWDPDDGVDCDWNVIAVRRTPGSFLCNCTIMSC